MNAAPTPLPAPSGRPSATRRLVKPRFGIPRHSPTVAARSLAEAHNKALRVHGSDSDTFHAFDVAALSTAGVFGSDNGFPAGTVVTPLAWGKIDHYLAQHMLEVDVWIDAEGCVSER